MKILLAQNNPYFPAHGGGDKSNRLLMEALAARGHSCRVVSRTGAFSPEAHEAYLKELAARDVRAASTEDGLVRFRLQGVEVHTVTNRPNMRAYFSGELESFTPEIVLASTDDPNQLLLESALKEARTRTVYLARATLALPFGPDCAFPSEAKAHGIRQCDRVVGVSEYVAAYIRKWGGMDAVHVPISLMESGSSPGQYPDLGRFENEFVTMVNPCATKGIAIFLALADVFPDMQFAAVPTWGTTQEDRAELDRRPNITVLKPVDRIDDLLARTRILVVPSVWAEARSRIVVEAMLRAVPVVASNVGGLPEAKMGVPYMLPVRPIENYRPEVDERMVPVAVVPPQDIEPWRKAVERLISDRGHYEEISRQSRAAALEYVDGLSVEPFERLLEEALHTERQPRQARAPDSGASETALSGALAAKLEGLSPEKRKLLALRLHKKAAAEASVAAGNAWFGPMRPSSGQEASRFRLLCFPPAGGGTAGFRGWADALPSASLFGVRLPGRESRLAEPPVRSMVDLVEQLGTAISPLLDQPFALFGHSMGAAAAFELARWLRKNGRREPFALIVAGARAPQFRLGHVPPPDPTEEEFLAELRRLEGVPAEVLDHPELMKVLLPALQADTALYRRYVYVEEEPLDLAIRAHGGEADPNVTPEHLRAWATQTSASFHMQLYPGGHFFPQTAKEQFLAALANQLEELRPG